MRAVHAAAHHIPAGNRLDELLAASASQQALLVRNASRFRLASVCQGLIERAWGLRFVDRPEVIRLAGLALDLARVLGAPDLLARALAHHGNACRLAADFRRAERELMEADRLASDLGDRALISEMLASVLESERRFSEALYRVSLARGLREQLGDAVGVVRTLILEGNILTLSGNPGTALEAFQRAIRATSGEPELYRGALIGAMSCLVDLGEPQAAMDIMLPRLAFLTAAAPLVRLKVLWVGARVASALGCAEAARLQFEQVRDAYLESGSLEDAALVILDLAAHQRATGAAASTVLETVRSAAPAFEALGIERERWMAVFLPYLAGSLRRAECVAAICAAVAAMGHRAPANNH